MEGAYARLEGRNFEFHMSKKRISIGRNSKLGSVDVSMGNSRFISRKHLEILFDRNCFFLLCRGKNGIFVDDIFQRRENKRLQLPSSCIIRFPSTQIKLAFTSLLEDLGPPPPMPQPLCPIKIDTTLTSPFVSPMPSPTGTISAVNSCPASPNSEFHPRVPSFDFMAKYASKLLSSQQASDGEGPSEASNTDLASEMEEGVEQPNSAQVEEELPSDQKANEKEESSQEEEHRMEKSHQKPAYSYAQLIVQALLASPDRRQTLSNIYSFIAEQYPYYRLEDKGWKNSIRHNLSLNQYFMKAPREKEGLGFGKGGYWCMHPDYEEKLTTQAYVKRKKKGIPVFPSAGLITRSAPPSPTHHPLMHSDFSLKSDLTLKEMESKFVLPTAPTSTPFALPAFFSSSHSLPASPSHPPQGFSATPLKFFPMGVRHSSSTDALALEKPQPRNVTFEIIREEKEVRDSVPASKRPRLEEEESRSSERMKMDSAKVVGMVPGRPIQVPTITNLSTAATALQFNQPSGGMQFLSAIPLMSSSGGVSTRPQALLNQPLSSFLPQTFFTTTTSTTAASQSHPDNHTNSTQDEEG